MAGFEHWHIQYVYDTESITNKSMNVCCNQIFTSESI